MPVIVRPATPDDVPGMLAIYAPIVRETAISFEESVPTVAAFTERVAEAARYGPWLVCAIDGVVVGYAYSTRFRGRAAYRWSTEVSVYVHPDYRRRRIAHALYDALLGCVRLQHRTRAIAGIALPHPDSVAFHEAYGFEFVGTFDEIGHKFGSWHGVGFWTLPLGGAENPIEPVEPAAVLGTLRARELFEGAAATVRI